MNNTVNTSQTAYDMGAADHASGASPTKPSRAGTEPPASQTNAASAEIVSLSSDATTSTQLLHSARTADGVDPATVQRLKGAIQNGTYEVPPEKLAQSIIGALKEIT
jgi:flagellar biosynthesis anti-sigma factor FlgM